MMPQDIGGAIGSGGFVSIAVDGQVAVRKLATWGVQINDMSQAWERVGYMVLEENQRQFESEGGNFGRASAWPQLAASTVADRERKGYLGPHPILFREGTLMKSATQRGAPGNIFRVQTNSLEVGTNYYTAQFHQRGTKFRNHGWQTTYGRRGTMKATIVTSYGMPPRPIVGINNRIATQTVKILNDFIQQAIIRSGLWR